MTQQLLAAAIRAAELADEAYSAAVKAAGFKSRWDYDHKVIRAPSPLRDAYDAKVAADEAMHKAFKASREAKAV